VTSDGAISAAMGWLAAAEKSHQRNGTRASVEAALGHGYATLALALQQQEMVDGSQPPTIYVMPHPNSEAMRVRMVDL